MKKIPTLFKRVYENHKVVDILPEVTPGFEWVLNGEGRATNNYNNTSSWKADDYCSYGKLKGDLE